MFDMEPLIAFFDQLGAFGTFWIPIFLILFGLGILWRVEREAQEEPAPIILDPHGHPYPQRRRRLSKYKLAALIFIIAFSATVIISSIRDARLYNKELEEFLAEMAERKKIIDQLKVQDEVLKKRSDELRKESDELKKKLQEMEAAD